MKNDAGEIVDLYIPRKWYVFLSLKDFSRYRRMESINTHVYVFDFAEMVPLDCGINESWGQGGTADGGRWDYTVRAVHRLSGIIHW
jgi:hypothetical protein